jgi:Uma2 family endonuclease
MAVGEKSYTAEDLWMLSHSDDDSDTRRYELDEGALIEMTATGDRHGLVTNWLAFLITGHVVERDLGEVVAAETSFVLFTNPKTGRDTVRAPDIAFIAKHRLVPTTGRFYRLAPDLAVEVVSPSDTARYIRRKVDQYLRAGTRLVWVVYPDDKLIDVYQPGQGVKTFRAGDRLDGGEVLIGFELAVNDISSGCRIRMLDTGS